jgi:integrase
MDEEGDLFFREGKTKRKRQLKIANELVSIIKATPSNQMVYVVTAYGMPFASAKGFSQWFVKARKKAGLPARCVPHGVRKGSGTIARKNGASNAELRSIYGWTSDKMVEHYTGGAINAEMAAEALHYLDTKQKH